MSVHEETQTLIADKNAAAPETSALKRRNEIDDGIIRVSAKEKNKGKQIGYAVNRLKGDQQVTLQAIGSAINSAIFMANAIRTKLGSIHQLVSLTESREEQTAREVMGIQILLSTKELDVDNVGYQKAELKGFWQRGRRKSAKKLEKRASLAVQKVDASEKKIEEPAAEAKEKRKVSKSRQSKESEPVVKAATVDATQKEEKSVSKRRRSKKPKAELADVDEAVKVEKSVEKPAEPEVKPQESARRKRNNRKKSVKPTENQENSAPVVQVEKSEVRIPEKSEVKKPE